MEEINPNQTLTPNVPPPPAEVKVRTMKSDIEGIVQAGGGLPQFRTVAVEGTGLPKSRIASNSNEPAGQHLITEPSTGFPWWLIALIVLAFLVLVFFGYVVFLKK